MITLKRRIARILGTRRGKGNKKPSDRDRSGEVAAGDLALVIFESPAYDAISWRPKGFGALTSL